MSAVCTDLWDFAGVAVGREEYFRPDESEILTSQEASWLDNAYETCREWIWDVRTAGYARDGRGPACSGIRESAEERCKYVEDAEEAARYAC